jgi:hypothetical protein
MSALSCRAVAHSLYRKNESRYHVLIPQGIGHEAVLLLIGFILASIHFAEAQQAKLPYRRDHFATRWCATIDGLRVGLKSWRLRRENNSSYPLSLSGRVTLLSQSISLNS